MSAPPAADAPATARAIWKGVVEFDSVSVPVKLYSAVEDKSVSFRLLNRADEKPVRQVLINPKSGAIVEHDEALRGFVADDGRLVALDKDELASLEPEASRTIRVTRFLAHGVIEYRWYERPYYLGPDGDEEAYHALAAALGRSELEGVAHWVMRNKAYVGALRLHRGYPMLVTLRNADEVLPLDDLEPARDASLDPKQVAMATQLIAMLAADFDPQAYQDEYRQSVLELLESKRKGAKPKTTKTTRKRPATDLTAALEKSLAKGGRQARAQG